MAADSAWINADVITMTGETDRAEGLVIEDGVITFVGDSQKAEILPRGRFLPSGDESKSMEP